MAAVDETLLVQVRKETSMSTFRRSAIALSGVALVGAGAASSAAAAEQPFGAHVADCAQMSLGQRPDAPQVTCSHDGMTFPNFGAMVQHMLAEG
jgi:hypothetical protein